VQKITETEYEVKKMQLVDKYISYVKSEAIKNPEKS